MKHYLSIGVSYPEKVFATQPLMRAVRVSLTGRFATSA